MNDAWLRALAEEFHALRGRTVRAWSGIEMAIAGGEDGEPPLFSLPGLVPCLQVLELGLDLDGGGTMAIGTAQSDLSWGLATRLGELGDLGPESPVFRRRPLPELPIGLLDEVRVTLDGGMIAEVSLSLPDARLLLMAGEIDLDRTGSPQWHRLDESVLVFTDPDSADRLPWQPARHRPGQSTGLNGI